MESSSENLTGVAILECQDHVCTAAIEAIVALTEDDVWESAE